MALSCVIRLMLAGYRHRKRVPAGRIVQQILMAQSGGAAIEWHDVEVCGPLDLSHARVSRPVILQSCRFDHPVTLDHGSFEFLSLAGCTVPALSAKHVEVKGNLVVNDLKVAGVVSLEGARVGADLRLVRARVGTSRRHDPRDPPNGAWTFPMCQLAETALDGDGMVIGGELDASGMRATGTVTLIDVHAQALRLRGALIESCNTALVLDRLVVDGSLFCDDDARVIGGVRGIGLQVGGTLYFDGAHLSVPRLLTGAETPDALTLDRARIGEIHFESGFRATGKVSMDGANIAGRIVFQRATLRAAVGGDGVALTAERAHIGGSLTATEDFGFHGALRLVDASIAGGLEVTQRPPNPADISSINAKGVTVGRDLTVFSNGTVDFSYATIGGQVRLDTRRITGGADGVAADLAGIKATDITVDGPPLSGCLDLTRAKIGVLQDTPSEWRHGSIVLNGLEYEDIHKSGVELSTRLKWLASGTSLIRDNDGHYRPAEHVPQPYEHLAATYRRTGHDRDARIIMCRKWRYRTRAIPWTQWYRRIWNYAQDLAIGYGYVPWRAFLWLLGLITAGTTWFWLHHDVPEHPDANPLESLMFTIGLALNGVGFDARPTWNHMGLLSQLITLALVLSGLTLGATVIAGITRAIRKS